MVQQREKFRIIGACTKMQRISLAEEIKLMDGVPYCFDFYQDFSCVTLNGKQIQDVSTRDLFELINKTESANMFTEVNNYNSQRLDYQRSKQIWEAADEWLKEESAFEKRSKKISGKEAFKNLDRLLKKMEVE